MNKFTKGPWQANNIGKQLACAVWANDDNGVQDVPVCTTSFSVGKYNEVDAETRHANCQLIAAAPELLEALRGLQKAVHDAGLLDVKKRFDLCVFDAAASKAIAKAEGRS